MLHFILFHKIKNVIVFSFFFFGFFNPFKKNKKIQFLYSRFLLLKKKSHVFVFVFCFFFFKSLLCFGKKKGHGLCPVEISTGHIRIRTRIHHPTCPVQTSTGHKSHQKKKNSYYKTTTITSPSISLNLALNC